MCGEIPKEVFDYENMSRLRLLYKDLYMRSAKIVSSLAQLNLKKIWYTNLFKHNISFHIII